MIWLLVSGSVLLYLFIQSIFDIKMMKVLVKPNNVGLFLFVLFYLLRCVLYRAMPGIWDLTIGSLMILIPFYLKIFSSGDAKALGIVLLSTQFLPDGRGISLDLFVINIIISLVTFSVVCLIKKREKHTRAPFFPYIFIGYGVITWLGSI